MWRTEAPEKRNSRPLSSECGRGNKGGTGEVCYATDASQPSSPAYVPLG